MKNKEINPIENLIYDGGLTSIFRSIAVLGDSLASGEHESLDEQGVKGYHDYYEYSWGQYIARKCGNTVKNYSVGGLDTRTFHHLAAHTKCFTPENACQCYIIALGVNDKYRMMEGVMEFGSMSDVDLNDYAKNKDTFVGNYVKIIQRIKELQPKARIFLITAPKSGVDDESQRIMEREAEFIRELPSVFDFTYLLDLRKYEILYDDEYSKKYCLGGHLSAMGYKRSADVISTYIDYIIRTNVDDFKQVGFIGKSVHNSSEKW